MTVETYSRSSVRQCLSKYLNADTASQIVAMVRTPYQKPQARGRAVGAPCYRRWKPSPQLGGHTILIKITGAQVATTLRPCHPAQLNKRIGVPTNAARRQF